jgi:O-methyltransferase involved in polyketide biosynthesis
MLRARELRFSEAGAQGQNFVPVVGDITSDTWDTALRDAGFREDLPTFIIAEGISMYFAREVLATVFDKLRGLTSNPESRFWLDHVASTLFDLDLFEVRSFLSSMARLGEPFVTGFDDPATIAPGTWVLSETTSAASAVGVSDAIHNEYRFSILKPA